MRLLLDTHVLVWWALGNERLAQRGRAMIEQDGDERAVSVASIWEAAIKNRLQRSDPIGLSASQLLELIAEAGFTLVSVEDRHALAVERLADGPGDPFDRLLVATAVADTWRLMTHDSRLAAYGDHVIVV